MEAKSVLRILFLEDLLSDFEIAEAELQRSGLFFQSLRVEEEEPFLKAVKEFNPDIIISDYMMPTFTGLEALKLSLEFRPRIPFIILTGSMNEETAVKCLKAGADDYVIKEHITRLPYSVKEQLGQKVLNDQKEQAERALFQSEENFRKSIAESPLGIRIVSATGDTIYANKAFLDIYEFSNLEEFTSTPAIKRYTPESYLQHQERKEKRNNGGDSFDYELSIIRKNGKIRHVKVSRKEVFWNGFKHFQVINQDITEQKILTIELIIAKDKAEESDRLKSAFLANISHEIRTPMNGILGFAGLLKEPGLNTNEQQEYIKIIEKSGARMLNIINDLMDISKIEAGLMEVQLADTNINEQIEYIYSFFKPEVDAKGIKLYFKNGLPLKESVITTDREKLLAILINLVKNAIKFSFGGAIEFGYELVGAVGAVGVVGVVGVVGAQNFVPLPPAPQPSQPHLRFYVKDQGIGIPKERQEAIFKRFVQADIGDARAFQGAGLGLSITKAYVEMLGGNIWVDSEEGKGSTFYFTIPDKFKTEEKTVTKNLNDMGTMNQNIPEMSGLKVLIVEDDENSSVLIELTIKRLSKEILFAKNGLEAVEACRNHPDIDLVLMDIKMPVMDGYEATRQIRQFNKDVIIVAQTAYAMIGDNEKAFDAGCNDYIPKPIKKEQLLVLLQKYF